MKRKVGASPALEAPYSYTEMYFGPYIRPTGPTVVTQESTVFVDCDDTLVIWGKAKKGEKLVAITNPHDGDQVLLKPHKGHIKILKDRFARGSYIVVWSAGGFAWANAVVKALGLQQHVHLIMTKPHMYMDDKHAADFMGERVYLGLDSKYGT